LYCRWLKKFVSKKIATSKGLPPIKGVCPPHGLGCLILGGILEFPQILLIPFHPKEFMNVSRNQKPHIEINSPM
jgi:hypothetical protein